MNFRLVAAAFALAALCWVSTPASTPIMPLSEVKPGMVGVGRTVFRRHRAARLQGHDHRRPEKRSRTAARPDHREARRRPARRDGRRRRHERQPGLHRWPPDRRRRLLGRVLPEGSDRRHHADRRDEGRDRSWRRAAPPNRRGSSCRSQPKRSPRRCARRTRSVAPAGPSGSVRGYRVLERRSGAARAQACGRLRRRW